MAVRNFWINARVDGRRTNVAGGPRARDGGMSVTIYLRSEGAVKKALSIECNAFDDGTLVVKCEPQLPFHYRRGETTFQIEAKR